MIYEYYNPTTGQSLNMGAIQTLFGAARSPEDLKAAGYYPVYDPYVTLSDYTYIAPTGYVLSDTGDTFIKNYTVNLGGINTLVDSIGQLQVDSQLQLGVTAGVFTEGEVLVDFARVQDGTDYKYTFSCFQGNGLTDPLDLSFEVDGGPNLQFTPTGIGDDWVYISDPAAQPFTLNVQFFLSGVAIGTVTLPAWLAACSLNLSSSGGPTTQVNTTITMEQMSVSMQLMADRLTAAGI